MAEELNHIIQRQIVIVLNFGLNKEVILSIVFTLVFYS